MVREEVETCVLNIQHDPGEVWLICLSENVQSQQNEKNKPSYVGIYTEKWIFYIWITDDYKKKDQRDCTYCTYALEEIMKRE